MNTANIAAELQHPNDLVRGRAASGPQWKSSADAVDRLWQDKVKPLLDGTSAQSGVAGAPPAGGGG
ncbi:MAG TPA: hypothetical protein VND19_16715 [Acetobacteraceae bacterium]|nr:hypothetical protein [Acetobacteraceae bacterium]